MYLVVLNVQKRCLNILEEPFILLTIQFCLKILLDDTGNTMKDTITPSYVIIDAFSS